MKSSDPLLIAWDRTLARKRDQGAIFNPKGDVLRTFGDIETSASAFETKLSKLGRGNVLGVQIGNHPDWPSILLACLRREVVVLPLDQSIGEQDRDIALEVCRSAGLVAAAATGGSDLGILPMRRSVATTHWNGSRPSLLKLTSGTTAVPRAIRFQSKQLLADCDQICETMNIGDTDLNFGVIPISHSYGFSNLLTPLIARGVAMVLSADRVPRAVLHDLDRSQATVFPGMPVFYQALCEMNGGGPPARLRLCISAGAPLSAKTAKEFREKYELPIHSFYGSSECGGICYDRRAEIFEDGFVGEPMENVEVAVIDPGAESSRIRVRSAAVGDDYYPEPEMEKLGNGMFVPDDLLVRQDDGFKIVGRISDLINVAGKKVNPAEVEAELVELPGVHQAVVFGRKSLLRNEEVAACVVADSGVSESRLLQLCRRRLSSWQVPKRIFVVEEMPVNERGKVSRRDLARLFDKR